MAIEISDSRTFMLLNEIYNIISGLNQPYGTCSSQDFDDRVFDLVDEFLTINEDGNYPNVILENSKGVDVMKVGYLFDICIWSTKDNGKFQIEELRKWLLTEDKRKVDVALSARGVFLFSDMNEFDIHLNEIVSTFPDLFGKCQFWREAIIEYNSKQINNDLPPETFMDKLKKLIIRFK